jgi:ATP synthase protein I
MHGLMTMADEKQEPSFEDFDARLRRLRQPEPAAPATPPAGLNRHRWGSGVQVGIELFAGILGGLILGYGLDTWLSTRPIFIIVFFLLGSVAGMLNAYRHLRRMQNEGGS